MVFAGSCSMRSGVQDPDPAPDSLVLEVDWRGGEDFLPASESTGFGGGSTAADKEAEPPPTLNRSWSIPLLGGGTEVGGGIRRQAWSSCEAAVEFPHSSGRAASCSLRGGLLGRISVPTSERCRGLVVPAKCSCPGGEVLATVLKVLLVVLAPLLGRLFRNLGKVEAHDHASQVGISIPTNLPDHPWDPDLGGVDINELDHRELTY